MNLLDLVEERSPKQFFADPATSKQEFPSKPGLSELNFDARLSRASIVRSRTPEIHVEKVRGSADVEYYMVEFGYTQRPPYPQYRFSLGNWTNAFARTSALKHDRIQLEIFASETHDEVLNVLSKNGLEKYRQDYVDYLNWRQKELEKDESRGIILQSLQSWAWFLIDYAIPNQLPYAKIDADFDGCIDLTWRLSENPLPNDPDNEYFGNGRGLIHLTFFPSYLNYLSVFSGAYGNDKHRIGFDGWFSHTKTKQVLSMFAERLQSAKRSTSSKTSYS